MKRFFPIAEAGEGRASCFIVQADRDMSEELSSMGASCLSFDQSLSFILSEALAGETRIFGGWSGIVLGAQDELEALQERLSSLQWERKLRN